MRTPARLALIVGAAALFAGCGGSQTPIGGPGAIPQSRATTNHADRAGSWMLPEASTEDLLYASDNAGRVFVFSYPKVKLVGTLSGFDSPVGICVDRDSNVWIANQVPPEVIEYAHGGTTPIATLALDSGVGSPYGCAIDSTSGNLAVVDDTAIAVFPNAQNPPTYYSASAYYYLQYAGYDNQGDLFSVGYLWSSGKDELAELPKGGSAIVPVFLNQDITANVVQWEGQYLAVGGAQFGHKQTVPIYQVSVYGSQATIVHTIALKNRQKKRVWQEFWIQGNRIIQPFSGRRDLGVWRYPQGGFPADSVKDFGAEDIWGVAVSTAPSRSRVRN